MTWSPRRLTGSRQKRPAHVSSPLLFLLPIKKYVGKRGARVLFALVFPDDGASRICHFRSCMIKTLPWRLGPGGVTEPRHIGGGWLGGRLNVDLLEAGRAAFKAPLPQERHAIFSLLMLSGCAGQDLLGHHFQHLADISWSFGANVVAQSCPSSQSSHWHESQTRLFCCGDPRHGCVVPFCCFQLLGLCSPFHSIFCHAGPPMERAITLLRPAATAGHCARRFLDRPRRVCRLPERAAQSEPRWTTANTLTSLMTQASSPSTLQMESFIADWCQIGAPHLSRTWGQLDNVLTQVCQLFLVIPQPVSRTQVSVWPTFHSLGFLVMLTKFQPFLQTCRTWQVFLRVSTLSGAPPRPMLVSLDLYLKCLMAHVKPVSPPWSPTRCSGLTMAVADWDRTTTRQVSLSFSPHPLGHFGVPTPVGALSGDFDAVSATNANLSHAANAHTVKDPQHGTDLSDGDISGSVPGMSERMRSDPGILVSASPGDLYAASATHTASKQTCVFSGPRSARCCFPWLRAWPRLVGTFTRNRRQNSCGLSEVARALTTSTCAENGGDRECVRRTATLDPTSLVFIECQDAERTIGEVKREEDRIRPWITGLRAGDGTSDEQSSQLSKREHIRFLRQGEQIHDR